MIADAQLKLLVCGSRRWTDREQIADVLGAYRGHGSIEIMHGDAPGADRLAADVAASYGFAVRAFPPDYVAHGNEARPMRNVAMLDEQPDKVIAFHDGDSPGTQHTIDEAEKRGIPVENHASRTEQAGGR